MEAVGFTTLCHVTKRGRGGEQVGDAPNFKSKKKSAVCVLIFKPELRVVNPKCLLIVAECSSVGRAS